MKYWLLFILSFITTLGYSQGDVVVTVNIIPPYSPNFYEYAEQPGKVLLTLTNTKGTPQSIYLKGEVIGDNGISAIINNSKKPSTPITLNPFQTLQADYNTIRYLFDENNFDLTGITLAEIRKKNGLPEGNYTVCIRAYNFSTNSPLSGASPIGCTNIRITALDPPYLIRPLKNEVITEMPVQNILFTWSNIAGAEPGTQYKFQLVEMLDTNRNINDAFKSRTTPLFYETVTTVNTIIYGPGLPPLVKGRKYAWAVTALGKYTVNRVTQNSGSYFRNNGLSEVWAFTYGKKTKRKQTVGFRVPNKTPQFIADLSPRDLHVNTFKGQLAYSFKSTETGTSSINVQSIQNSNLDVSNSQVSNSFGLNNSNTNPGSITLRESPGVIQSSGTTNIYTTGQINNTMMSDQESLQSKINQAVGGTKFPLVKTEVEIYMYYDELVYDTWLKFSPYTIEKRSLIGKGFTNVNGEFSIQYFGDLHQGKKLDVIIKNEHFQFSSYNIAIQPSLDGTYDVGLLLGVAKTFRIKLKAKDENGNTLDNAGFKIYRVRNFYHANPSRQNLQHEGTREGNADIITEQNNSNGSTLILRQTKELVAEGNGKETFSRLFYALNYGENYIIQTTLENGTVKEDKFFGLGGVSSSYVDESVFLFEKTIIVPLPNPVVAGNILIENSTIPADGAKVHIKIKEEDGSNSGSGLQSSNYFATADSGGHFKLENIAAKDKPYELVVTFQGQSFTVNSNIPLNRKGMEVDLGNIYVKGHLEEVCGKVVDDNNNEIAGAVLRWKNGNSEFFSDDNGYFMTSQVPGDHTLIAKMSGFRDKEFTIQVGGTKKPVLTTDYSTIGNYKKDNKNNSNKLIKPPTYNSIGMQQGGSFNNGISYEMAGLKNIYGTGSIINTVPANDCKNILKLSKFYIRLKITDDQTNMPIAGAKVRPESESSAMISNEQGILILGNMPIGVSSIIVNGPTNSSYIGINTSLAISNPLTDTLDFEISLERGIELSGYVKSGEDAVDEAEVFIEGKEHLHTTTDETGEYKIAVPAGNYAVIASKQGFIAERKEQSFSQGQIYSMNFNLKEPGFNATKLLGYDMILTHSQPTNNPDEFEITGYLNNVSLVENFKPKNADQKLYFDQVLIRKNGNKIEPVSSTINLNTSSIELIVFGYLKGTAYNANGLVLKPLDGNAQKGRIESEIKIDLFNSFTNVTGLNFQNNPLYIQVNDNKTIEISRSDNSSPELNYGLNSEDQSWELYGFELIPNFQNSLVNDKELRFSAALKINSVPGVSSQTIEVNNITITKTGVIKEVTINSNINFNLSSWELGISSININSYGICMGGDMNIDVPGTVKGSIGISNLLIKPSGISGGEFYFPNNGLDFVSVVKIKGKNNNPFALQRLPASNHYQLAGGVLISLSKYINENIDLPLFSLATNGQVGLTVKPNLNLNFADMASIKIDNLSFVSSTKTLDIGGKIKLNIPNLGLGAGTNLHFSKSAVSMDEIEIEFNLANSISMDANLLFSNNEFAGGGNLKLASMNAGIGIQFHYKKVTGGVDVGASFKTGMVIPIGVVKMDQLGGGFDLNTATNIYSIFANGRITFAADPAGVVALNPVTVKITSTPQGPIFEGGAKLVLMNSWNVGQADFKLDFADQYYYINANMGTGVKLMKGVSFSANGNLHLELSTKSNNSYWFVSATTSTSIAKIFNASVTLVGGWNVSKSQHADLNGLPSYTLNNGKIYGGYFNAYTSTSVHVGPLGIKGIASFSGSLYNNANITVFGNVKQSSYGIKFENGFGGSFSADFFGIGIAGASLDVYSGFEGYYNSGNWGISGELEARLKAHIGCNGGCNKIVWGCCFKACVLGCRVCPCPCGATVCVNPGVRVSYSSQHGMNYKLKL